MISYYFVLKVLAYGSGVLYFIASSYEYLFGYASDSVLFSWLTQHAKNNDEIQRELKKLNYYVNNLAKEAKSNKKEKAESKRRISKTKSKENLK